MNPLLDRFIAEAQELIQQSASGVLRLEKDPGNEAVINEVFRAVHTLKGSSGLFNIQPLTHLVHAGEDLLSAVRSGALELGNDIADHILDMLDQVGVWIGDLERDETLPPASAEVSRKLASALRKFLPQSFDDPAAGKKDEIEAGPASVDWVDALSGGPEFAGLAAAAAVTSTPVIALEYRPQEACFYSGEDPVNLMRQAPELYVLSVSLRSPWPSLDDLDPYRCNLVFRALTLAPADEIAHLFRYVMDQVSITTLPPDFLASKLQRAGHAEGQKPFAASGGSAAHGMALRIAQEQLTILALPGGEGEGEKRLASVRATLANIVDSLGDSGLAASFGCACETCTPASIAAFVQDWQNQPRNAPADGGGAPANGSGARASVGARVHLPAPALHDESHPEDGKANGHGHKPTQKVLKVDQGKMDSLMNLIGELVVSKNSLPFLARRAEDVYGSRELAREIKDQYGVIDRLAQEMQAAIMAVRLQPVSEAFDRFPRLVRDLARKLSKKIDLSMEGENTAADKAIIAALGEPLLHIVRNSIDHGVEMPEERAAAGKSEQALIGLKAYQESDQIVIEVTDDGRGIDPAKIKSSALSKGVITGEQAERMPDQEAINLVFQPGFSTASQVTDLSGRGVGMDVVRSNIEKLGGQVTVSSVAGKGTTVRLFLPLSMAVTRVMMVEVGTTLVGIPMDVIVETVRLSAKQVYAIKHSETFVLRDTIIPLVRMCRLLGMPEGCNRESDLGMAVLVVRVKGALVGLTVDQFRESIDVILKPFEGLLSGLMGYAGTALLGDGRVLLVLNLKEIL
jgi:two-component system chemotaxis sensor kinase CheA